MKKKFDCVDMKRKGQDAVRSATSGMTRSEVLEFWKRKTDDLRRRHGAEPKPVKRSA